MNNSKQTRELPEEILDEIKNLIEEADESDIIQYAKRKRSISKGFRLESKNVSTFRKKIISTISANNIDPRLGMLSAPRSLCHIISNLSKNTIDKLFPSFIVVMRAKFLSVLFLDSREEIRAKALDYLDDCSKIELPERAIAENILLEHMIPSENILQYFEEYRKQSDGDISEQKEGQQDCKAYLQEIAELEKKLSHHKILIRETSTKLKKAEKTIVKLKDRIEKQQQKENDIAKRLEAESEKKNKALSDKSGLQGQLDLLKMRFDEKLKKEINTHLKSSFNHWLTECEAIENEVEKQDKESDPVMAEAEVVLQQQREMDRHTGNRLVLHDKIKKFQEMLHQIRIAQVEAVNPVEKLRSVEIKIDAEINRITHLLGHERKEEDEFIKKMCARINESDLANVNTIKKTLDAINDQGIYAIEQLIPVYKRYKRRMSIEYAAYTTKDKLEKCISDDPIEWLWRSLQGRDDSLILILDGYNIIGRLERIFKEWSRDCEAMKDAREDLISRLEMIEGKNLEIILFFDSPTPDIKVIRKGLKIIFSGGGEGKNRADEKIIDYLKSQEVQKKTKKRILVTDDLELRQKGEKEGARSIPVAQFAEHLESNVD